MNTARSIALIGMLLASGCSNGAPPTHPVSGTITASGQPVANAEVGFIPVDLAADAKPAHGRTDENGRYTLSTYLRPTQEVKGAMAGAYKVTVSKGIAQDRIVEYEELARKQESLPATYAAVATTPLSAKVMPSGENQFDFELE